MGSDSNNSKARKDSDYFNHHVVPPVFLVVFTIAAQVLAHVGNPERPFQLWFLVGDLFSWTCVLLLIAWALFWLWVPSKTFEGPTTHFNLTPVYQANGELYYFASLIALGLIVIRRPKICIEIYENMGPILGCLNITALSLCAYLMYKAKTKTDEKDPYLIEEKFPIFHEFYRGMELHPRLLGVDVKQFTNCRLGMIMWQLLVIIYFFAGWQKHGFDAGHFTNALLQTIYIYKFFHWETGYFNTLDITLDRAGYYLCWGCLVWIPSFYTFHSYFFVYHVPHAGFLWTTVILTVGLGAVWFNYDVDRQKEVFRGRNGGNNFMRIWKKEPKYVAVSYTTTDGTKKKTKLLTSGWWGVARKINYTFELVAALVWCIPAGLQYGLWPFAYFIFLSVLLVHRIFRDEKKCHDKYGTGWEEYCKLVPYRLIPNVF